MDAATEAPASRNAATLSHWLRLLWDRSPPIRLDSEQPHLAAGTLHLPANASPMQQDAAAAHAAAHLVYSPASFDGRGLVPIARALVGLLEDARVEALAVRELPGLARLWRAPQDAEPMAEVGVEALLRRLARVLADPYADDPEPWVRKGRDLFWLDRSLGLCALRTPAEVRRAASRLGHDLGQMRLPFNARTYRPWPAYRDDHRWMWHDDAAEVPPRPGAGAPADDADDPQPVVVEVAARYPEWDRLIDRLRPDWCSVLERHAVRDAAASASSPVLPGDFPEAEAIASLARRMRHPLRALAARADTARRSEDGDAFDLAALTDWHVARRIGRAADGRVFRAAERRHGRARVWFMLDRSASAAATLDARGRSALRIAADAAEAGASALHALRIDCTVAAFSSFGRHAVRIDVVKAANEPPDPPFARRLLALQAEGSTRLGAALRHAAARLAARAGDGPRWLFVLSDGEPHDIDVHDPRYLVEDARRAVDEAARRGVRTACLVLGARPGADALRIFGGRRVRAVQDARQVPGALRRLLG